MSRRGAPRMRSVEVTGASFGCCSLSVSGTAGCWEGGRQVGAGAGAGAGTGAGGTLSPVKLRNIPREILQPVRAGSSGTILHLARRRPRHVANNEDRWHGLWRPDTVPRLLIGRINQRFHRAAPHPLPPLPPPVVLSRAAPLFSSPEVSETLATRSASSTS